MKHSKAFRRRLRVLSAAALRKAAIERAQAYRVHIEWALRHQDEFGRPISLNAAADRLNEQHLESPMGGRWYSNNVGSMASRLGLPLPPTPLPSAVLRARVRETWRQHPEFTARQVIESLGTERPAGFSAGLETIERVSAGCCQAESGAEADAVAA
jgi:hypothetical protein